VYKALLEMYSSQEFIAEKYRIDPEIFNSVAKKVGSI
jgi:hypothetical protein